MRRLRVGNTKTDLELSQSIDSIENPFRLATALLTYKHLSRTEVRKYPPYLRCSTIHSVCVREQILGWRLDKQVRSHVDSSLQMTFDIGNAVHFYIQNSKQYFGDKQIGYFECMACGHVVFGRKGRLQPCQNCKAHQRAFFYKEHHMSIRKPFRLSGHQDLFLEVSLGDVRIADIKTLKTDLWKKLEEPYADHKIQVHGYMIGAEYDTKFPIKVRSDRALLIYVPKEMVKGLPFKAFHVRRDDSIVSMIVDELELFRDAYNDESIIPPLHQLCERSEFGNYQSRSCPVLNECRGLCNGGR